MPWSTNAPATLPARTPSGCRPRFSRWPTPTTPRFPASISLQWLQGLDRSPGSGSCLPRPLRAPSEGWPLGARGKELLVRPRAFIRCMCGARTPKLRESGGETAMALVIEPVKSVAQIDEVLAIEEASFTNPWTREMYLAELANPGVSYCFLAHDRD